ncbi:hypothetical protein [Nitrospirillum iridis]|uniref:Uncharacterized protein n=1 Tax=Nitrospirillum iridis TaxID=765888 RepID=A0A7X0AWK2_9PROT|nr:hypothetical protein [Nitrospirillum iridis]MBB6251434.1 hypothetical protein [Nitrospirillum iridis]
MDLSDLSPPSTPVTTLGVAPPSIAIRLGQDRGLFPKITTEGVELSLRVVATLVMLGLFTLANWAVIDLIKSLAAVDRELLDAGKIQAADRLIDNKVIITLIAGTVTQVATFLVSITRYLFPTPDRPAKPKAGRSGAAAETA